MKRLLSALLCLLTLCTHGFAAERDTPAAKLAGEYDVVIAGAGTGGFGAAMQAARMGASVLIVEESDWIGGQMNAAAVTSMDEGPILVRERGIYHEFVGEVEAHYKTLGISAETAYGKRHICMEPRVGQDILYKMLGEARSKTSALHVALRTKVNKVLKDGDTVTGVEIESVTDKGKESRTLKSKILIDATEWGDVIPLTGAQYRVGNSVSGSIQLSRNIQDNTWTAVVKQYPKGVPKELFIDKEPPGYAALRDRFAKTLIKGDVPGPGSIRPWNFGTFIGYRGMPNSEQPGVTDITRTHLNFNNDHPTTVRDVEVPTSRLATNRVAIHKTLCLIYYIQHSLGKTDWAIANDEGYDTPYNREQMDAFVKDRPELAPYRPILYHFSVNPYTRESRRIVGLHTLKAHEIERKPRSPIPFETVVALGDYAVDLHGSKKPELLELELDAVEDIPEKVFGERGTGPFAIPFECFIPEKVDGFLPAEKNISQSRLANGATRLQPSTMLMGQAAGAIAALSIKNGIKARELDPVLVQQVLLDAGDTLNLNRIKDIGKSSWEWASIQLVTVRGLMTLEDGKFLPGKALVSDDLAPFISKLSHAGQPPEPGQAVTGASLSRTLQPIFKLAKVKLNLDNMAAPTEPVTRLDLARILADFLNKRALAKLSDKVQVVSWPAPKKPTALSPQDIAPQLAADLQVLLKHQVIDEIKPWITPAGDESAYEGAAVAAMFQKTAQIFKPGSSAAEVLDVLLAEGFISSKEYWVKYAVPVPGAKCAHENVVTVIRRIAQKLGARRV